MGSKEGSRLLMNIIYDFKTKNGEVYRSCTFIHYLKNIRGGKYRAILSHASDSIRIFDKNGNEIKGINFSEILIIKAMDVDNEIDITDKLQYMSLARLMEKRFID
jgi:hypothetical protein